MSKSPTSRGWLVAAVVVAAGVIVGISVGWPILLTKVTAERDFGRQVQSENNLKSIGLTFQMVASSAGRFPAAAIYSPGGKPLLSWRVTILPFVFEKALYDQFHLGESWDSPHNAALIPKMPSIYAVPGYKHFAVGKTCYLAPVGEKAAFFGKSGRRYWEFIRGDSKTALLIVEAAPDLAVVWTKPDDLAYDEKDPWAGLLGFRDGGFLAVHADGASGMIPASTSDEALRGLFSISGGEAIPPGPGRNGRATP